MNGGPCTRQQLRFFKEQGYIILESLIPCRALDAWRSQIWKHFGSSLETPATWPDNRVIEDFTFDDPSLAFGRLPEVTAVVEQLGGGQFAEADGWPLFTWPAPPGTEYVFPHTCHLDAYGDPWQPFMLGATAYLYDVAERGGGFGFWPGSHLSTHRHFVENPEQIDGRFRQRQGWSWAEFSDRSPEPARQFTGKAGDVIFWHNFLVHGASINVRSEPRFGMFALFYHRQQEQIKGEIPEDLWKYWAI